MCMDEISLLGRVVESGAMWTQNHILISSSETADGVSTPDSVMMPDIRSGGCQWISKRSEDMVVQSIP
jgi:hypothetical protein